MLWGRISYKGTIDFKVIQGNMHSVYYIDVLQCIFLPKADAMFGGNCIFYKNTAVHTFNVTKEFLEASDNDVIN